MSHTAAIAHPHAAGTPRFPVRRTALSEAGADAALGLAWVLLWMAFLLALAPAASASATPTAAAAPAGQVEAGAAAQPDPGPSSWGVAPRDPGGAG